MPLVVTVVKSVYNYICIHILADKYKQTASNLRYYIHASFITLQVSSGFTFLLSSNWKPFSCASVWYLTMWSINQFLNIKIHFFVTINIIIIIRIDNLLFLFSVILFSSAEIWILKILHLCVKRSFFERCISFPLGFCLSILNGWPLSLCGQLKAAYFIVYFPVVYSYSCAWFIFVKLTLFII